MAEILRRYEMDAAWYVQVQLDDGRHVEMKASKAGPQPKDAEWLAMAATLPKPTAPTEPVDPRLSNILAEYAALKATDKTTINAKLPSVKAAASSVTVADAGTIQAVK